MIAARIIAHRAGAALAPENTLAALALSAALGVSWVEMDARILADDTVVVFHDDMLDRCTDGSGPIAERTWSQVRGLDAGSHFGARFTGEHIPRLDAVLRRCRERGLGLNLELKVGAEGRRRALVTRTLAAIERSGLPLHRLLVSSFDSEALRLCRRLRPDVRLAEIFDRMPADPSALVRDTGIICINVDWRSLDELAVRRAHVAALEVYAWTANDAAAFAPLWQWGIDGVFTDDPRTFLHHAAVPR